MFYGRRFRRVRYLRRLPQALRLITINLTGLTALQFHRHLRHWPHLLPPFLAPCHLIRNLNRVHFSIPCNRCLISQAISQLRCMYHTRLAAQFWVVEV